MADGFGLREKLDARIAGARRSLFWPALVRAIGPTALWLGAFLIFWLTGLYGAMPLEAQATAGVIFWVGLAAMVLVSLRVWKGPSDDDARDLIDSTIEGRPLSAWADRPARTDQQTWKLWQAHRDRMAALAAKIGKLDVAPQWKQADPFWLRAVAPALVLIAVIVAGAATPDRVWKGLFPDFGALVGAHKLTIEAWITPPPYTGSAPFVLTSGEAVKVPEHSEITLRAIGPVRPQVKIFPEGQLGATLHPQAGLDGAYEAKIEVDRPMRVVVDAWGERASFPFTIIPDTTPTVSFVEPPKLGEGDRTDFKYKLADDYGVEKLELVFIRTDTPAEAGTVEDAGTVIDTVTLSPKEEEGAFSQDLVRHRWAGLDLKVKLRATDASGAFGESAVVDYHLPEKIFLQPISRAVQEERATLLREWRPYTIPEGEDDFTAVKGRGYDAFAAEAASRMRYAPEGVKLAALMIDSLTYAPGEYFQDPIIFMGLRNARAIIDSARSKEEADSAEGLLWDIALRAEYGSLADATAALEAARRALEDALRRGASEDEIKRLMDMYEQAVENYLAAKMAEALRNGNVQDGPDQQGGPQAGGMQMGDDELTRMLQALRDLAETGARDQARQLLSDMQRLLDRMENMQITRGRSGGGQQQDGPMSRALNRALQETNRALNDQRDLNDQTDQAQRDGSPQRGQQLADQQRALRERLEQQQRSGGGQGQQQQQGQGQQQGQQGQGQGQGQQGQQPGQGQGQQQGQGQPGQGQGQQPGQGQQQGQGGQGNQPGNRPGQGGPQGQGNQNADRGGNGGAPGRPGVNADGTYGQENGRSRQLLGNAIEMQRRAEDALRRGDFQAAREAQQQAMAALQDRSSELAKLNDENDPEAREQRDQRDILGRLNSGESGYGENIKIPDEVERDRARNIRDEIRRRAGNRALTKEELDYLNRLLQFF